MNSVPFADNNGFTFSPHDTVDLPPILTEVVQDMAEHVAIGEEVNHPAYYNQGSIEVIDLIEHMTFNRGNAVKCICRAGYKPGVDEILDLEKSIWYLEREIERVKSSRSV